MRWLLEEFWSFLSDTLEQQVKMHHHIWVNSAPFRKPHEDFRALAIPVSVVMILLKLMILSQQWKDLRQSKGYLQVLASGSKTSMVFKYVVPSKPPTAMSCPLTTARPTCKGRAQWCWDNHRGIVDFLKPLMTSFYSLHEFRKKK